MFLFYWNILILGSGILISVIHILGLVAIVEIIPYLLVSGNLLAVAYLSYIYLTIWLNSLNNLYVLKLIFWGSLGTVAISSANCFSPPQFISDSCLVALATVSSSIQSFWDMTYDI